MHYILSLIIIVLLSSCKAAPTKQPTTLLKAGAYIGYLENVTLNYTDRLAPSRANPDNSGEFFVTYNCGSVVGTYKVFESNEAPTKRVKIIKQMGEWCRNPFRNNEVLSTDVHLLLLGKKIDNQHYTATIIPIYATEHEVHADIRPMLPLHDKFGNATSRAKSLQEFGLLNSVKALHQPMHAGEWRKISQTEFNNIYDPEFFSLENNSVLIRKGILLEQNFPDISEFLIQNNFIAFRPIIFVPPNIE